jgi:hypothetical protein
MANYYVGKFKGRKTTHLFTSLVKHENPVCKREEWRRFPKVAIVFPINGSELSCSHCKNILYGGGK